MLYTWILKINRLTPNMAGSEMALLFYSRTFEYLQCIWNRKSNIEGCDIETSELKNKKKSPFFG